MKKVQKIKEKVKAEELGTAYRKNTNQKDNIFL